MKLAIAGKGGVGKTSFTAWLGDYLHRRGRDVFLVDADTALSLGQALGLAQEKLPVPLIERKDLVRERIGKGLLNLNPEVSDLPDDLSVDVDGKKLLVMGSMTGGGGCACDANALLKAVLAYMVMDRDDVVLVDLEAGVEPLGRGTVRNVDGLVIVSEPSMRGLQTAASVGGMAREIGLEKQILVLNRAPEGINLPDLPGLPPMAANIPYMQSLADRQLMDASVLGLPEQAVLDIVMENVLREFR